MSEIQATAPTKNDTTAFLDDLPTKIESKTAPVLITEPTEAVKLSRLKFILPALSETDARAVLTSLQNNGIFTELLAQFADARIGRVLQERFQTQIAMALSQMEENRTLNIEPWI